MSQEITTSFINQFRAGVMMLAQQKGSKLRSWCKQANVIGEAWDTDQVGSVGFSAITNRHGPTQHTDTPHRRRWGFCNPFAWSDLIDKPDLVRTLNDPTNPYVMAAGFAAGRAWDNIIVTAASAAAATGKTPTTGTTALPTAQKILKDGGLAGLGTGSGTAVPLTVGKLLRARSIFAANNYAETDLVLAVHPYSLVALLGTVAVGSSDYNQVQALINGSLTYFCGFNIVQVAGQVDGSDILPISSNLRTNVAFARGAIEFGIASDLNFTIDRMPTLNNSTQAYAAFDVGATRLEEVGVVTIVGDETAANPTLTAGNIAV